MEPDSCGSPLEGLKNKKVFPSPHLPLCCVPVDRSVRFIPADGTGWAVI